MLSNSAMKPGRFLKLHIGRQRMRLISEAFATGRCVYVCTMTRATRFTAKHAGMFRLGASGSVYVQRGRAWDCIDGAALRTAAN